MLTNSSGPLALLLLRGFHFGGGRGSAGLGLLLVGLIFAAMLFWAIQHSRKSTT